MHRPTPEQIVEIAKNHVRMYEKRLSSGSRFVRVEECKEYLKLWKAVETQGGNDLTPVQQRELQDALDTGEWDHFFNKETT